MSPFNTNGPKAITVEMYERYRNLQPANGKYWTFFELFNIWIDEHYPDSIRQLALRDLLFQDGHSTSAHDANDLRCHRTSDHFGHLYHANFNDGSILADAIRNRPKLIREFVAQLEYNLKHGLMPDKYDSDCDRLIEIVVPLANKTLGQKLWRYHSSSTALNSSIYTIDTYSNILKLCLPSGHMPEWLISEIRPKLINRISEECQQIRLNQPCLLELDSSLGVNGYPATTALLEYIRYIDDRETDLDQHGNRKIRKDVDETLAYLINTAQSLIPAQLPYLQFFDVMEYAPRLQDPATIIRFLERHLKPFGDDSIPKKSEIPLHKANNFFYWAAGFAKLQHTFPTNYRCQDLCQIITNLHCQANTTGVFKTY